MKTVNSDTSDKELSSASALGQALLAQPSEFKSAMRKIAERLVTERPHESPLDWHSGNVIPLVGALIECMEMQEMEVRQLKQKVKHLENVACIKDTKTHDKDHSK